MKSFIQDSDLWEKKKNTWQDKKNSQKTVVSTQGTKGMGLPIPNIK